MQARRIAGRLLIGIVIGGFSSAAYSQTFAYPPPFASGMASGAQFGAHVSAMYPTLRCSGGRSFSCGAHFDLRPILAGALIGGLVSALSTPVYYPAPFVREPALQPSPFNSVSPAPSIADTWLQPPREPSVSRNAASSQFVDSWQRFFEPVSR